MWFYKILGYVDEIPNCTDSNKSDFETLFFRTLYYAIFCSKTCWVYGHPIKIVIIHMKPIEQYIPVRGAVCFAVLVVLLSF